MVKADFKITDMGTVADINHRDDLILIDIDRDRKSVIDSLPLKIWDYFNKYYNDIHGYSFFVKVENGEYKEIYAYPGTIPYIVKTLLKIEWWYVND